MKFFPSSLAVLLPLIHPQLDAAPLYLKSPDGTLVVGLTGNDSGSFGYTLGFRETLLIQLSALGLDFGSAGKIPNKGWQIHSSATRTVNSTWKPLWAKRSVVRDHYHETTVELTGPGASFDRITVTFRAYDDDVAFRYSIPADARGKSTATVGELTEFHFAGDFTAWFYNGEQHTLGPETLFANSKHRLHLNLAPGGGSCVMLVPVEEKSGQ